MSKRHHDRLRAQGESDFLAGKPVEAFFSLPLLRHTELARESYENGWRGAFEESRRLTANRPRAVLPKRLSIYRVCAPKPVIQCTCGDTIACHGAYHLQNCPLYKSAT